MGRIQKYFWATIGEDGSQFSEYNPDGSTNYFPDMPKEVRDGAIYFGLASSKDSYFFDLATGEYHFRDLFRDEKHQIKLPVAFANTPLLITGPLPKGQRCSFYQYKEGHTDFNMAFETSGNVIDKHIIGYKVTRTLRGRNYFIDCKLSIDPDAIPVKPLLEVTLRGKEDGPVIGVYTINL